MKNSFAYVCILTAFFGFSCADEFGADSTSDRSQASTRASDYLPNATHQAEDYSAISDGCSFADNVTGYTGSGFVVVGGNGTWFRWDHVDGGPGGKCTLTFRYANKDSNKRECGIKVNGVFAGSVDFAPTSSWSNWSTETITVTLNSGMNDIRIAANSSSGGPNIDKMEVTAKSDPNAPNANFTYSTNNQTVSFTDNSSDPNGWISNWQWKFGDGASSNQQNPSHTYSEYGIYNVELTVTNNNGIIDTKNVNVVVGKDDPYNYCVSYSRNSSYEWIGNVQVGSYSHLSGPSNYTDFTSKTINLQSNQNYSVTLTPKFSNNSYNEHWRIWIDFNRDGDFFDSGERVLATLSGNSTVSANIQIPASVANMTTRMRISMKYNAPPTGCEIFDGGEVEDYTVKIGAGGSNLPNADFTYTTSNRTAYFTDNSSDPDGYISNWYWEFGDGSTSNQENPTHAYSYDNTYNVKLTVTDNNGNTNSISKQVVISGGSTGNYCNSRSNNSSYEWIRRVVVGSFSNYSGANNYTDFTSKVINLSRDQSYSVTLTPQFSNNAFNEHWRMWIDFNQDGDFYDSGERIITTLSGSYAVSANIYVPSNAFEGKTRMRVSMKYDAPPTACEIFEAGEVEDYTVNIGSGSSQPSANFTFTTNNRTAYFTDNSSDPDGYISNWYWEFGDGSTSNQQNPTHTYSYDNTYNVKLTVTDNNGNTNSISKQVVIDDGGSTGEYCASRSQNNSYEWIRRVAIGSYYYNSGASVYSNFTSEVINLSRGQSYYMTLTPQFSNNAYNEYWRVWIDFNQDGDFFDQYERIITTLSGSSAVSANIYIPNNAYGGKTRMRVSMKFKAPPTACEIFEGGEVEDYTVNINY